jgi:predicted alpha/beta-fold hydrolase
LLGAVGCASFPLPPFDDLAGHSAARTFALRNQAMDGRPLNRAAVLPGRSQADIKARLEGLWNPSRRLDQLVNYNGLMATRFSQLNTKPGPAFRHGTLSVQHLGQETRIEHIAAFHPGRCLPLVVGTSGINGTVDGKITVDILQDLYDSGDFHVVHLESVTSVEHEVRNQRAFAGGFPEGLLLYEALAELRARPEYAGQIAQVHLLGASFGGLLCGIAAHCEGRLQLGVVDGAVLAFSPPLDVKQLFQNIAGFQ